jgi:galactokinase
MSSSAALSVATLTRLDAAFNLNLDPLEVARLAQRAETRGSGVRVGILDQAASVLGQPSQAVLIDCRSLAYSYVPFSLPDVSLLICETGVERSLASSAYNQRRTECEQAAAAFAQAMRDEGDGRDIVALRDVSGHDFMRLGGISLSVHAMSLQRMGARSGPSRPSKLAMPLRLGNWCWNHTPACVMIMP